MSHYLSKKIIEKMSPMERRKFLKLSSQALGSIYSTTILGNVFHDIILGEKSALAMTEAPVIRSIEINLRDQWDLAGTFIAPGLRDAKKGEQKGVMAGLPIHYERPDLNFYLTQEGLDLKDHLDNIAVIETGELNYGRIHGHQAANKLRIPDATHDIFKKSHMKKLWMQDTPHYPGVPNGNEPMWGTVPTISCLHNYWLKTLEKSQRSGMVLKGGSRHHTAYHYCGEDQFKIGQLNNYYNRQDLFRDFPAQAVPAIFTPEQADLFKRIVQRIGDNKLKGLNFEASSLSTHTNITNASINYTKGYNSNSLELTQEDINYWGSGVLPQVGEAPKFHLWEQVAFAYKALKAGVNTIALEFDYLDWHSGPRTAEYMRTLGNQLSKPLSRLLNKLKEDESLKQTLIHIYTTDGSRSPDADSEGLDDGKNAVIFAGPMIKGGYYGDIRTKQESGIQSYTYHPPHIDTGAPHASPASTTNRLAGKHVWATAAKALGIPDTLKQELNTQGLENAKALDFLLRT